jgi:predicted nucleic acid-binding protein
MTNGSGGTVRVLDSWAIIALIQDEPAAERVEEMLDESAAGEAPLLMSWYNAGEAFYILAKRKHRDVAEEFMTRLPSLPIRIVLPDENAVMAAARIKAGHPVAFGDAFVIGLALANNASVITGDNEIRKCGLVAVDWIGD